MKKNAGFIVRLTFGLLGAIYVVVGIVGLTLATKSAGDIRRIFTLPEDGLAFATLGTTFTALGVAFLLVTLILLLVHKRRKQKDEELMLWGSRVTGVVTEVKVDYTVRINRRNPLIAQVRCELPTGEVTLKSRRLWNACPNTGDKAEVVYDPMDEKKYLIWFEGE